MNSELGVRLREERQRLGLTQNRLGRLGGVAANAQAHYENGKRVPKSDYLISIRTVGVDIVYLLTGERSRLRADAITLNQQTLLMNFQAMHDADQALFITLSGSLAAKREKPCRVL